MKRRAMGSVVERKSRGWTRYYARLRVSGRDIYGPCRWARKDAEGDLAEMCAAARRPKGFQSATVVAFAERMLDGVYGSSIAPATLVRHRTVVESQIKGDPIAVLPIDRVAQSDVQAWVQRLAKSGLSVPSIHRSWAVLGKLFSLAREEGADIPEYRVKLPSIRERNNTVLGMDSAKKVLESPQGVVGHMVRVALLTGLRRGELVFLRWEHIDEENKTLYVPGTKTKGSATTMPLDDAALESILAQPKINQFVFNTYQNRPYSTNGFNKSFREWREKVGLPDTLRFHDIRGSFATLLIQSGADIKTVQTLMRHTNPNITMRHYIKYSGQGESAIGKMKDMVGK